MRIFNYEILSKKEQRGKKASVGDLKCLSQILIDGSFIVCVRGITIQYSGPNKGWL